MSGVGIAKVRKSLQQVFDELNTPEFIFIDRGCIVNIIQIMKVSDGMAVLKNGEQPAYQPFSLAGGKTENQSVLGGAYMMEGDSNNFLLSY